MALCSAGCDKRIINTNNNIPLDKTVSNTTIPAPSAHNVSHSAISMFSSVCRVLKDHYFIAIASTVIVIAGSYYFLKNKPDAIIITLFKRDAAHVAENAEQINEHYKLSKKSYTAHKPRIFFILFKNFCLQNPTAFQRAAFHFWNSFIHGFVFD